MPLTKASIKNLLLQYQFDIKANLNLKSGDLLKTKEPFYVSDSILPTLEEYNLLKDSFEPEHIMVPADLIVMYSHFVYDFHTNHGFMTLVIEDKVRYFDYVNFRSYDDPDNFWNYFSNEISNV